MSIFKKLIKEYGGFEKITSTIDENHLNKYCDSIYQQYGRQFKNANYMISVNWVLRHYHASKKMTLSALFYTQAKYLIEHNVKNLSLYSLYYSLFNAFSSNIILLPSMEISKTQKVSHSKVFTYINEYFVKHHIYQKDIINLLNELRLMREAYSYNLPLGGRFMQNDKDFDVDLLFSKLSEVLPIVFQVSNMLSYLSYYAWEKKVGKITDDYGNFQSEVDDLFFSFITLHNHMGKHCLIDEDDYQRQAYVLNKVKTPFPISWFITEKMCEDLECGWEQCENGEGYDINEVSSYLSDTIDAF